MKRKLLLGGAGVLALLVLAGYLLLYTGAGLRGALRMAGPWLPGTLRVDAVSGRLAGPLELRGVSFESPQLSLAAGRLRLDWRPLRLLAGAVEVTELSGGDIELDLPARAPASSNATEPPPITSDWAVSLRQGRINGLRIVLPEAVPVQLSRLDLQGELAAGVVTAQLAATDPRGDYTATGRVDTRQRYRHRLIAGFRPAAAEDEIEVRSDGDLETLVLAAEAPAWEARLEATVSTPLAELRWQAQAAARLPGLERVTASGSGTIGEATLALDFNVAGYPVRAEGVRVDFSDQRLRVHESTLRIPGLVRRVELAGTVAPGPEPSVDLALQWIADTAHPGLAPYLAAASGNLNVTGTLAEARLDGAAALTTPGGPIGVRFGASGDRRGLDPVRIEFTGDAGALGLLGAVSWDPALSWRFDLDGTGLDPGVVWPGWSASLDLGGRTAGGIEGGLLSATLDLDAVGGTFRGQPVAGTAAARLSAAGLDSLQADLTIGENRIEGSGQWAGSRGAEAQIRLVDLDQLVPGAGGKLEARLSLVEQAGGLALSVGGSGRALTWGEFEVAALEFEADSPSALRMLRAGNLRLTDVRYGAAVADALEVSLAGPWNALNLSARVALGDLGAVALDARVDAERGGRSGRVERLEWESTQYGSWTLREATAYRIEDALLELEHLCLIREPGLICANVGPGPDGQRWELRLDGLPAELVQVPLSISLARPLRLTGEISGRLDALIVDRTPVRLAGQFEARDVSLSLDFGRGWQALPLGLLRASVSGDATGAEASASAESELFSARLEASLGGPPGGADSALQATLAAELPKLAPLVDMLGLPISLGGQGRAELTATGTIAEPVVAGRLAVSEVKFEAAAYGSRWRNGRLETVLEGGGKVSLTGAIDAEQGTIQIEGQGDHVARTARLNLSGEAVRVANTPTLLLELSPALQFTAGPEGYRLRGSVDVVNARIEQFEGTQSAARSPDVVVVDEPREPAAETVALSTDLRVRFQNPAQLSGYGMEAELSGELRVVDTPNEVSLATGELRVGGSYKAYGQDLTIEEGRLIYAQTPLDNPSIRASAYREIGSVRAGVRISGRAADPQLSLFSEPAMSDNEILSYLILGRPSAAGADLDGSELVTNAALQLGLSQGNNVVGQVGSKLGFDQMSIAVDEEFGGAAVSIGRYLSPRLYLSYSTGLVQAIDLLTFEYRLGRKWMLQTEIGVQTRTKLSYELERGRGKD